MRIWEGIMEYTKISVNNSIDIDSIVTVHYFEYRSDFVFNGEQHDFWELEYVDKGEIDVFNGKRWQRLKKGDVIFHRPNEFHSLKACGEAPNLVVVSFGSTSEAMDFFREKCFRLSTVQSDLLASIIREARRAFACPLDDPNTKHMTLNDSADFGSFQLVSLYLQHLLIDIYREGTAVPECECGVMAQSAASNLSYTKELNNREILNGVIKYLEENICRHLTIDEICRDNMVGYSCIKQLFHDRYQCGVLEYFNKMRIEYAKQLIRSNGMNVSEISDKLGYSSIHYFSRQFKRYTGMAPTEYSSSVMLRSEIKYSLSWLTA